MLRCSSGPIRQLHQHPSRLQRIRGGASAIQGLGTEGRVVEVEQPLRITFHRSKLVVCEEWRTRKTTQKTKHSC